MGILWGAVALVALAQSAAADTATLNPGTLTGTVSFSGVTLNSGYLSVRSSGGYQSSGNFSGSTYSLTVEGGHSYLPNYVQAYIPSSSNGWTYLTVYGGPTTAVGVNETVVRDFSYNAANITGAVTVLGAPCRTSSSTRMRPRGSRHTGCNPATTIRRASPFQWYWTAPCGFTGRLRY